VKLREISAAYTFDGAWSEPAAQPVDDDGARRGRNRRCGWKYRGLDPETNVAGPFEQVGAAYYFNLPLTRSFVVSVSLNR
jgi:hypothetical protein